MNDHFITHSKLIKNIIWPIKNRGAVYPPNLSVIRCSLPRHPLGSGFESVFYISSVTIQVSAFFTNIIIVFNFLCRLVNTIWEFRNLGITPLCSGFE